MKKITNGAVERFRKFWKKVDGQDIVEYALLLFLVALAAVASTRRLGRTVANVFTNANNELVYGGTLGEAGVDVTSSNSSAQDLAAEAANGTLSAAYAQDAADAAASGNILAAADLAAASAVLGNGLINGLVADVAELADRTALVGAAGNDDAEAAQGNTRGNNVGNDVSNANAAVAFAATLVAQAAAALNGATGR